MPKVGLLINLPHIPAIWHSLSRRVRHDQAIICQFRSTHCHINNYADFTRQRLREGVGKIIVSSMAKIEMVIFGINSTLLSLIDLTMRCFKYQNEPICQRVVVNSMRSIVGMYSILPLTITEESSCQNISSNVKYRT